jgi:hypothetical protein
MTPSNIKWAKQKAKETATGLVSKISNKIKGPPEQDPDIVESLKTWGVKSIL